MTSRPILLFSAVLTFCITNVAFGYSVETPEVHQYLTKQSVYVTENPSAELFDFTAMPIDTELGAPCGADYDAEDWDDAVIGSGEEDHEKNPLCPSYEETPALLYFGERCQSNEGYNGIFEHFYNPDIPWATGGINCRSEDAQHNHGLVVSLPGIEDPLNGHYDSAYRLFEDYWVFKILPLYQTGRVEEAYYWLGRAVHLLQDMAVPAHTHLIPHDDILGRTDSYESHPTMADLELYLGVNYTGESYLPSALPNLPSDFDWSTVYSDNGGIVPDIFKIFWYVAQRTQYFGVCTELSSNQATGNDTYVTVDGVTEEFFPSLWYGTGIDPIANPSKVCRNADLELEALIPHALRAVGGLYEVFENDIEQFPTSEWTKALTAGQWNYFKPDLNAVASLHASYVIYNGKKYSVPEALDAGIIANKLYAWYGEWYTNKADLDEWKVIPGNLYAIWGITNAELHIVTIEGYPHTSVWFKPPQVWLR